MAGSFSLWPHQMPASGAGWAGAGQTTKVKGLFVHPEQVTQIARRHPEFQRMRLVVDNPDGQDRMMLLLQNCIGGEP